MKIFLVALVVLLSLAPCHAQEYNFSVSSNGKSLLDFSVSIEEEMAFTTTGDVKEEFDLKNMQWKDERSGQFVPIAKCKEWAKASKKKTEQSTIAIPEQVRSFVKWQMNPKFDIEEKDGVLKLTSGQVDYEIKLRKIDGDVTNYYKFAKLNSYKKAMIERKLAPFAELRVLELLESRNVIPTLMTVTIPGVPGAPEIKIKMVESEN